MFLFASTMMADSSSSSGMLMCIFENEAVSFRIYKLVFR